MNRISPSGTGSPAPNLSPRALMGEAFDALWRNRTDLLRIAVAPVGATLAIDVALLTLAAPADPAAGPGMTAYLLLALSIPPAALLAINWLRVLLLGPAAVPGLGLRWGASETRFLLRMLGILLAGLLATFVVLAPVVVAFGLVAGTAGGPALDYWLILLSTLGGVLIYAYVSLRLSPALAALAAGQAATLGQAWAVTRGQGGRLLLAGVAVVGPFYLLMFLLPALLHRVGLDEAAPLSSLLAQVVLASLTSAAGFALVAVIYRRLGGRPAPQV